MRNNVFTQRVVRIGNARPERVGEADSLVTFKGELGNHLKEKERVQINGSLFERLQIRRAEWRPPVLCLNADLTHCSTPLPLFPRYYRNTHGVIIVYDVTNPESFVNVKRWLHEISQNCDTVSKILVGNKNEDPSRRQVEFADAKRFSEQMGIRLFETSAKENTNVEEMFNAVTFMVLKSKKDNLARLHQQSEVVKINKPKKKPAVKKCC
uniref:ras-related protein Rab-35-like n=1 Tax=Pristiophorus japonicus TaxID=55135 RepID=UPI00398F5462